MKSIDLMEKACQEFVIWFTERFDHLNVVGIVCGSGNNGGDGLGIARLLSDSGFSVKVFPVKGKETEDYKANLNRLPKKIHVAEFIESSDEKIFAECTILIDALFGSGLSRSAEGVYAKAINAINLHPCIRIAVDIPSGLFADQHSEGAVVKAHHTVAFQLPKLAFMFPENNSYTGQWHLVDIGLNKSFIKESASHYFYLKKKSVSKILKTRSVFSNKGDYGKALIIAGSFGKMGACILAARACLRAGVGLLTVHIPKSGYSIIQSSVPEAMASVDSLDFFSGISSTESFDVIGIGPGLGQAPETLKALSKILDQGKPLVIDADALNLISANRELFNTIPSGSILTPHPKEFERLVGSWKNDFERLQKQIHLAKQIKCVIVLKGACTSIATPEGEVYFNSTGNPGMATGGTGDVLTGILTGLLAQNYSSKETAILGVFLHGLAGDLAAREKGMDSLIAGDLIEFLPLAFRNLAG
ncbi:MAG: NAD(P)H-hydrate dehydratase [Cyclobacteriaceae bacterium]|nr:NAD(P)H-hydrate dehydratase [Cyclobacteriaceae bacterium]